MAGQNSIIATGSARKDIVAAATTNIKGVPGKVGQIVVWNTGASGATVDLYDDPSGGTTNHCWSWAFADGKGIFAIQYPMINGIVVVTAGATPASISVVYT
jgi:hypothetical protein